MATKGAAPPPSRPPPSRAGGSQHPPSVSTKTPSLATTNGVSQSCSPAASKPSSNLAAAAGLIKTLDAAFANMSASASSAASDAEEARRNARAAAEVARRYGARSYSSTAAASSGSNVHGQSPRLAAAGGGWELRSGSGTVATPFSRTSGQPFLSSSSSSIGSSSSRGGMSGRRLPRPQPPPLKDGISKGGGRTPATTDGSGPSPPKGGFWNHQGDAPSHDTPNRGERGENPAMTSQDPGLDREAGANGKQQQHTTRFHDESKGQRHPADVSHKPAPPPPPPSTGTKKRKGGVNTPSPSHHDRLARSHAEDVLSLSLELERTKQALTAERAAHAQTQTQLVEYKAKAARLEGEVQKLLDDLETERESHGREADSLRRELERASVKVKAAEEDAQLALDLAKGCAESREQADGWLQRALYENDALRAELERLRGDGGGGGSVGVGGDAAGGDDRTGGDGEGVDSENEIIKHAPPANMVNQQQQQQQRQQRSAVSATDSSGGGGGMVVQKKYAASASSRTTTTTTTTTVSTTTSSSNREATSTTMSSKSSRKVASDLPSPPRAMISAGRDLLRRAASATAKHTDDGGGDGDDDDKSYRVSFAPRLSAERRQRLRERLRYLDADEEVSGGSSDTNGKTTTNTTTTPTSSRDLVISATPSLFSSERSTRRSRRQGVDLGYATRSESAVRGVLRILRDSGQRLNLGGRWWTATPVAAGGGASLSLASSSSAMADDVDVEVMTRNYCQSVEVKINRQMDELKGLEALCEYLEQKVVSTSSATLTASVSVK